MQEVESTRQSSRLFALFRKHAIRKTLLTLTAAAITGCASPWAKFYEGVPDARVLRGYENVGEPIQVYMSSGTPKDDVRAMWTRGYVYVGHSSFIAQSTSPTREQLIEHAQKIGAQCVITMTSHAETVGGVLPLTIPANTTSHTSGSATAFGSRGGSVTAYGNSTTTTYGSTTSYVPYSVERSNFTAAYFAKLRTRLGILTEALTDAQKHELQSNAGLQIIAVASGSSAYDVDILPGDLLLSIAGSRPSSRPELTQILTPHEGSTVDVEIYRDGKRLIKRVPIRRL